MRQADKISEVVEILFIKSESIADAVMEYVLYKTLYSLSVA